MPRSRRVEPFVLIVTDRDAKTFSVEGPMTDDTSWNAAVCAAQDAGLQVNCHTPGDDARSNVERAAHVYRASYPEMTRVPAGSIVRRTFD